MIEEIVKDHATWKKLLKNNSFRKWYKKSSPGDERANVIDMMCASWNNINHELVVSKADVMTCYYHLNSANKLAESISTMGLCHFEGWKLHRDWFKCMVAQLSIDAAIARDNQNWGSKSERNSTMVILNDLYETMEWDLASCLRPKDDGITRVAKVDYKFEDIENGVYETRFYKIIIEPTNPIPLFSVYESKNSGKQWEVIDSASNGDVCLAHYPLDGEKKSNYILRITPSQVFSMKRIK